MEQSKKSLHLHGIVPPLVTPLLGANQLDADGLEKLLEHVIKGGVHGLFILGTTGEISRLSDRIKEEVIRNTCRIVKNRVPVLVGITDTAIFDTLRLAELAFEAGADAVVLAPPFYYHVEQDELSDYFLEVADSIQLPLYLYNMPSRTNINIEVNTVAEVAKHPNILGIKDSSGDLMYIQSLIYALREKPDFSVFVGPEEIMAQSVLHGASGGVNGGANLYPGLFVELYEAARNSDIALVNQLQMIVTHISNTLYKIGANQPNFTKIIKESLSQKGICGPYMEKPYIPFSEEDRAIIGRCLENIYIPASLIN
jgi:dihydrodipicolinate synthase/N-acetylneuraminate lyase